MLGAGVADCALYPRESEAREPVADEAPAQSLTTRPQDVQCVRSYVSDSTGQWHRMICRSHGFRGPAEHNLPTAYLTPCGVFLALVEADRHDRYARMLLSAQW